MVLQLVPCKLNMLLHNAANLINKKHPLRRVFFYQIK